MSNSQTPAAQAFLLGQARVRIEDLRFDSGVRDYDEKNVNRLARIYALEGCCRDERANYIPAVVSRDAIRQTGYNGELEIAAGTAVHCLHGKHRVLAARKVLPVRDQWWTVAVYDTGW